jgi:hypothetical protein
MHGLFILGLFFSVNTMAQTVDTSLSYSQLMNVQAEPNLVKNVLFKPPQNAQPALSEFRGTIKLSSVSMRSWPKILSKHDAIKSLPLGNPQLFPAAELQFVTEDGNLIPVQRDWLPDVSGKSFWHIIVQPGKIWSQPGDQGMSRAAFPFMIYETNSIEAHHGLAIFLYNQNSISPVRIQIVQSSAWVYIESRVLAVAQIPATFDTAIPFNSKTAIQDFKREIAAKWNEKPLDSLRTKVPTKLMNRFDGEMDKRDFITSGLFIGKTIYSNSCRSGLVELGNYPYCEWMRHNAQSVTKSAIGAVATLAVAQKVGDAFLNNKVENYLTIPSPHDGWKDVRVENLINMSTGMSWGSEEVNPNDSSDGTDFYTEHYVNWIFAGSMQEKINLNALTPKMSWKPGDYFRYNDEDISMLGKVLDDVLKEKLGAQANLETFIQDEVFKPIGVYQLPILKTQETTPFSYPRMEMGAVPTTDDLAKLTYLLQHNGNVDYKQILHKKKTMEALGKTGNIGLPDAWTLPGLGAYHYHMTFWNMPYKPKSCRGKIIYIPIMMGYGGVLVSLFPNGMTGYRIGIADPSTQEEEPPWDSSEMADAADHLDHFCNP